MRTILWLTTLLAGCVPGFAPPAHYAAMGPTVLVEEPEIEVAASCCFLPALGLSYDASLGGSGLFAGQIQGQFSFTHASVSPALVLRSRGETTRYGLMLGATGGMGDLFGFLPYQMPYGAGGLHFLLSSPTGRDRQSRFTLAAGGELSVPIVNEGTDWTTVDDSGNEVIVLPLPNAFISLDLRYDIATRGQWWFFVGGGLDVSPWGPFVLPTATLGGRG